MGLGLHLLLLPAAMDFLNYINKSLRKEKGKENASFLFESGTGACLTNLSIFWKNLRAAIQTFSLYGTL